VSPVLYAVYISEMVGYVEERADVKALSFVDDVAWWAEGRNETEVARKLTPYGPTAPDKITVHTGTRWFGGKARTTGVA